MKKVFSIIVILVLLLSISGCTSESAINTEPTLVVDDSIKASVKPTLGFQVCLIYGLEQGDITYTSVEEKDGFTTVTGSVHLIPMDGSDEFDANFNIVYIPSTEEDTLTGYRLYSFESDVEAIMEARMPSPWEVARYIDEFGDPSGGTYLRGSFEGVFSNSATAGSDLQVYVFYNSGYNHNFGIKLIEYGSIPAYTLNSVEVKVKINDVITSDFIDSYNIIDSTVYIDSKNEELRDAIYTALMNNERIQCIVTTRTSKYNFEMNGRDFSELVNDLS